MNPDQPRLWVADETQARLLVCLLWSAVALAVAAWVDAAQSYSMASSCTADDRPCAMMAPRDKTTDQMIVVTLTGALAWHSRIAARVSWAIAAIAMGGIGISAYSIWFVGDGYSRPDFWHSDFWDPFLPWAAFLAAVIAVGMPLWRGAPSPVVGRCSCGSTVLIVAADAARTAWLAIALSDYSLPDYLRVILSEPFKLWALVPCLAFMVMSRTRRTQSTRSA